MKTLQIIDAIRQLSLSEKMHIVELIFKDIKKDAFRIEKEEELNRKKAAELLLEDYQNDSELTAFTVLDKDDFYEAK